MNKNMKLMFAALTTAVMTANEIQRYLQRRKAEQEALEFLRRTRDRLEQFQYDMAFASMIQDYD